MATNSDTEFCLGMSCELTNLISGDASDFENGLGNWNCYDRTGSNHGQCHIHHHTNGRTATMHIHGGCSGSQGGIQQTFETIIGTTYRLKFVAFAGNWDGEDTDTFYVSVDSFSWQEFSHDYGEWGDFEMTFTAKGATNIIIWSDIGHCLDVDDITLEECTDAGIGVSLFS